VPVQPKPAVPPPFDPEPKTAVPGAYIPGSPEAEGEASPPKPRRSIFDRIFRR
jgi:hypothetical protein